jgi:glutamate-ammonia-ligase adenylyltransferase
MPDKYALDKIRDAAAASPDPARAERNLQRFLEAMPGEGFPWARLGEVANLFGVSQFLANFSVTNPAALMSALGELKQPVTREGLFERSREDLVLTGDMDVAAAMRSIRLFKKRYLLGITMRDITGAADVLGSVTELTRLAEVVIDRALAYCVESTARRYGEPEGGTELCIVGLGKLGAEELNYSSDIDIIAVYADAAADARTAGVRNPSGLMTNRITVHEFYCKVIELLGKVLSSNTEDGIAYRVDLRLRPQGQKGEIALPLTSYRAYYESWGRTWERMVLIRARPVAGDIALARTFIDAIEPFVWKRTVDYAEIENIRAMKKKIDTALGRDDIKRGYGGIREVEFFVQTFQLIYCAERGELKTHRLYEAMEALRATGMVPGKDLDILWRNYLHFRRLEHYLQMKDDRQTHSVPKAGVELEALSKAMGFESAEPFVSDLRVRRMQVKNMYNSLLGTREDIHGEALSLLEGDLTEGELTGYLSFRGVKEPSKGLRNLQGIREHWSAFRTQRELSDMRRVVPALLENALGAESPDRALAGLESFFGSLGIKEAYLTALMEQKALPDGIVKLFSLSSNLTRVFLSNPAYLNLLIEEMPIRKTLKRMREETDRSVQRADNLQAGLGEYKNVENLRLGIYYLTDIISIHTFMRFLSHLADVVVCRAAEEAGGKQADLSVIALGKLGGREITFGSDLDIIFLSENSESMRSAQEIIKTLTAYTGWGMLYNVDVRLRPHGTKGSLVMDLEGYREYYMKRAHKWEIQALLRARPVLGGRRLYGPFMDMAREVIFTRSPEVKRADIHEMRQKILQELSRESEGIDIKLGPGGLEELEFYVQWLQLSNAREAPEVLVQNTSSAIKRLAKRGVISAGARGKLSRAYEYFRRLETFTKLNDERAVIRDTESSDLAALFMGHGSRDEFLDYLRGLREGVLAVMKSEK